jgi:hypothetical protein
MCRIDRLSQAFRRLITFNYMPCWQRSTLHRHAHNLTCAHSRRRRAWSVHISLSDQPRCRCSCGTDKHALGHTERLQASSRVERARGKSTDLMRALLCAIALLHPTHITKPITAMSSSSCLSTLGVSLDAAARMAVVHVRNNSPNTGARRAWLSTPLQRVRVSMGATVTHVYVTPQLSEQ